MRESIWSKKIPTLLGIVFIFAGIIITTFLVNQTTLFRIKAGGSNIPKNVKITNITDGSFTVSYLTDDSVLGSVNFSKGENLDQTALDERDLVSGKPNPYKVHSVTTRNLSSATEYSFAIVSGTDRFVDNGEPYKIITGEKVESEPSQQKPLAGKIITEIGDPPEEGVVYLRIEGAQEASVLLKNDGSYILPLNSLRSENNSSYFDFSEDTILNLSVFGDSTSSNTTLSLSQINPVPVITLGQNYDFKENKIISGESSPTPQPTLPENKVNSSTTQTSVEVPKDNQTFSDQKPEFSGVVSPNQKVEIEIHSDENLKTSVSADSLGNWAFRPNKNLSPGEHTITISTSDQNGFITRITRKFTVYAQGSQFTESTPSGSATPVPSPNPSISQTLTISPTPTPTLLVTPSSQETPSPVASSSPTPFPPTGANNLINLGAVGLTTILMGLMVFFLASRII